MGARRVLSDAWSAARLAWGAASAWLIGYLGVTVLTAVLPVATVWLLKDVLDTLASGHSGLPASALGLVAVGLATGVLPAVSRYVNNHTGRLIGRHAQSDLYLA